MTRRAENGRKDRLGGRRVGALAVVLCLLLGASAARAASFSGRVTNTAGTGLASMRVTLWAEDEAGKGWFIVRLATTGGAGSYTISGVGAGEYKLHARMAPGVVGNYADRWYDVAPPLADGYVGADADVVAVGADEAMTGIDFALPIVGGLDGRVLDAVGTPLTSMQVRVERASDPRIHHNDWTKSSAYGGAHWGRFYMRGLPPAGDYRVLVHDPNGTRGTRVVTGPFTVQSNVNAAISDIALGFLRADPREPNDSSVATGSALDASDLHADPPVAFESGGAFIGPRDGDIDWYCFDAVAGDRLLLTATSVLNVGGLDRENPWVDPMLGLFDGSSGELLRFDDDSGPGARDAFIDTAEITSQARLCAVVSTYGDTTWSGRGQGSAGQYRLRIEMGNRRPLLSVAVEIDDEPAPEPVTALQVEEGQLLVLQIRYDDPDHDALAVELEHLDNAGGAILLPTLALGSNAGTYTWPISETAAEASPYTLALAASDGELAAVEVIVVEVVGVNRPPSTPVLLMPLNGATVREATASLVLANSVDVDGDPLQYEFEVYWGDTQAAPDQAVLVVEGENGGETRFVTATIADDTVVSWRARAFDGGTESAYSPWTELRTFLVDAENSPPTTPALLKPDNGEEVIVRWPTFSVRNSSDPEGDAVAITFEVYRDAELTDLVTSSDPILQSGLGSTTNWSIDVPLEWGATYFARAFAADDRGAASDYSNINSFRIKPNEVAGAPGLGEPFASQCDGYAFGQEPPDGVQVANVVDPEGEAVSFELEIFAFDADPERAEPLVSVAVPQDEEQDFTVIPIETDAISAPGHYRVRVRAFDGTDYTEWADCDFWVSEPPRPASPLVILAPEAGTLFPRDTEEVVVVVQNAYDPAVPASEGLEVAWCISPDPTLERCDPDPAVWLSEPQTSMEPTDTTQFTIGPFEPGRNWWLRACARSRDGVCRDVDETQFSIQQPEKVVTPGCSCGTLPGRPELPWLMAIAAAIAVRRRRRP